MRLTPIRSTRWIVKLRGRVQQSSSPISLSSKFANHGSYSGFLIDGERGFAHRLSRREAFRIQLCCCAKGRRDVTGSPFRSHDDEYTFAIVHVCTWIFRVCLQKRTPCRVQTTQETSVGSAWLEHSCACWAVAPSFSLQELVCLIGYSCKVSLAAASRAHLRRDRLASRWRSASLKTSKEFPPLSDKRVFPLGPVSDVIEGSKANILEPPSRIPVPSTLTSERRSSPGIVQNQYWVMTL